MLLTLSETFGKNIQPFMFVTFLVIREGGSSAKQNTRSIKWQRKEKRLRKELHLKKEDQLEEKKLHLRKRKELHLRRKRLLKKEEGSFSLFKRKLQVSFLFLKNRGFSISKTGLSPRFFIIVSSDFSLY